ncbi:MAG: hypothetical protein AAFZ87_15910 [Planctomycetota bacterium]
MNAIELLVLAAAIYVALGALFALAFVLRGVQRIDPDAAEGSWGFRVLILPGAALLWPYLALRWARGTPPPRERTPHKRAALAEGER